MPLDDLELDANPFDGDGDDGAALDDEVGPELDKLMTAAKAKKAPKPPEPDFDVDEDDETEEPEPVASTPAPKKEPEPRAPSIPAALIEKAKIYGISPEVAATYPTARELDGEIFRRQKDILAIRGTGEAKKGEEPPKKFKLDIPDEESLDPQFVKTLRSMEGVINELSGKQEQLEAQREQDRLEAIRSQEARSLASIQTGFDSAVEKIDGLSDWLGRPSDVLGKQDSEQYGRWEELATPIRILIERHVEKHPEREPDWEQILRTAAGLTWPDLNRKLTQKELQKSLDKAKGSVAIRGADRAPVKRRPKNEEEDRGRFRSEFSKLVGRSI